MRRALLLLQLVVFEHTPTRYERADCSLDAAE
jgi:hypothetical protein